MNNKRIAELRKGANPDRSKGIYLDYAYEAIHECVDKIEQLQNVICYNFGLNPDTSDGTELIGREIMPMPDEMWWKIVDLLNGKQAENDEYNE